MGFGATPLLDPTKLKEVLLEELAEQAVRLGSIDTFDRGGNVIWLDNFEDGITKWVPGGIGTGHATTWDSTRAKSGSFSAKLTTGDAENDYENIVHLLSFPVLSRLGFEYSFSLGPNVRDIQLNVYLHDGNQAHYAEIKWVAVGACFYYLDSANREQALSPVVSFRQDTNLFNTIKLVVDFISGEYVKLIANNTIFDMTGLKYRKRTLLLAPYLRVQLQLYTSANAAAMIFTDDVIITQNEP